jgi:hypothetical protein
MPSANTKTPWGNPGSSFLWVGDDLHLNREEIEELVAVLEDWLEHKRLPVNQLGNTRRVFENNYLDQSRMARTIPKPEKL